MRIRANAKINLTLDILRKREDGYHIIDSIMQSISLCDYIDVQKFSKISVSYDGVVLSDGGDICQKAADKFFEKTGVCGGADIKVQKQIPYVAGLGGSSVDAAAVICALDRLYGTELSIDKLCEIGLCVGADVPFCIVGGTARVGGIGEIIEPITPIKIDNILLIKSGEKLSTADMYNKVDAVKQPQFRTESAIKAIENGDMDALICNIGNAFSLVTPNEALLQDISKTAPAAVSLSGSGPTVFAIYQNSEQLSAAEEQLKEMGYNPIKTESVNSSIVFE